MKDSCCDYRHQMEGVATSGQGNLILWETTFGPGRKLCPWDQAPVQISMPHTWNLCWRLDRGLTHGKWFWREHQQLLFIYNFWTILPQDCLYIPHWTNCQEVLADYKSLIETWLWSRFCILQLVGTCTTGQESNTTWSGGGPFGGWNAWLAHHRHGATSVLEGEQAEARQRAEVRAVPPKAHMHTTTTTPTTCHCLPAPSLLRAAKTRKNLIKECREHVAGSCGFPWRKSISPEWNFCSLKR